MKLKHIYECFIREGIWADPRTPQQIRKALQEKRREYRKRKAAARKFFDSEKLKNPYADLRILHGDPQVDVKRMLVGIDIDVGELVMADRMAQKGEGFDLVLAHHPKGIALAGLDDVMRLQTDLLVNLGIKKSIAGDLMGKRIQEVARNLHSVNHARVVDAAKLLDIPLMCCHTPADNHVARYLQKLVDAQKPKTLEQIVRLLMKEPEYRYAAALQAGPQILIGKAKNEAGKVFVDMTGGTEGSKDVFARLSQLGVRTLLGMHYSQEHFRRIKSEHINVVNAGHIASDNLGMNLILDRLTKKADIEIVCCSGFRRFRR
ncbi:MAG: NGG1p interacting factor NIF3 [Omnitrophica WOR_2 bacterium RIFCSPHIGHO2_02_FULL_52_10]|nr:MAG: NGG1p interacting factor NIF3 [Omnitrophica WOR_2 bacterium RIFCSPHIGHO2_02_FULL_52_10]